MAAAFVLFNYENHETDTIQFYSPRSGTLIVTKQERLLTLNFPADTIEETTLTNEINNCFNIKPKKIFKGKTDYLLVFENEEQIKMLKPLFGEISKLKVRGVIVTAKGNQTDFVSRFFAPQSGIDEDPVTGSAHTTLTPYWSKQLGKTELTAIQLSNRKGRLECRYLGNRVEISGQCRPYLIGEIYFGYSVKQKAQFLN